MKLVKNLLAFSIFFSFFRWPAMVEADPDVECYYEMGPINSLVPVRIIISILVFH